MRVDEDVDVGGGARDKVDVEVVIVERDTGVGAAAGESEGRDKRALGGERAEDEAFGCGPEMSGVLNRLLSVTLWLITLFTFTVCSTTALGTRPFANARTQIC